MNGTCLIDYRALSLIIDQLLSIIGQRWGARRAMRTVAARVDFGEFSAQEEELRRIVDPHEKQYDAPRGAIRGFKTHPHEIEGDQLFSNGEKQRRDGGSDGNVAPV